MEEIQHPFTMKTLFKEEIYVPISKMSKVTVCISKSVILLNEETDKIYVTHTKEKRLIPLIYKDFKSILKSQQLN